MYSTQRTGSCPFTSFLKYIQTEIAVTTSARTEQLVKKLSLGHFRRSDIEAKRVQWSVQLGNFFRRSTVDDSCLWTRSEFDSDCYYYYFFPLLLLFLQFQE
ncbi:hypothetical protein NPIL_30191 [Nephila pilipes]|uniref:Uncharacterized protein n=1 Tax=Nephila pilipes TaxID=299642 RepID=A0A8X6ULV6_NEPPI|nr:hypothetical protein NPIL_30191 [Nephila pilipes]